MPRLSLTRWAASTNSARRRVATASGTSSPLPPAGRVPGPRHERTCEVVVHVRGNAIRAASAAMPHVAVRLAVVPRPTGWRWRAGGCGRARSDPVFLMAGVPSRRFGMCTSHPTCLGGRSGPSVLEGRHRPVAVRGACSRGSVRPSRSPTGEPDPRQLYPGGRDGRSPVPEAGGTGAAVVATPTTPPAGHAADSPATRRPRPAGLGDRRENIRRLAAGNVSARPMAGRLPNRERCRSGGFPGDRRGAAAPLARARMFYIACAGLTTITVVQASRANARKSAPTRGPRRQSSDRRGLPPPPPGRGPHGRRGGRRPPHPRRRRRRSLPLDRRVSPYLYPSGTRDRRLEAILWPVYAPKLVERARKRTSEPVARSNQVSVPVHWPAR